MYVLGIDAGGTKTMCLLADADGRIVGEGRAGGANLQAHGELEVEKVLHAVIEQAVGDRAILPKAVCLGVAGVDRPEDHRIVSDIVRRLGYRSNALVVNDAYVALVAGCGDEPGVVLISGTGSIAYGVNEAGFAARAGGWGYVLGDEGSGYWIGRQALTAVVREADGRGPRTQLTALVLEHFQLTRVDGLVREVYDRSLRRQAIGALGPLVDRARAEGGGVGHRPARHARCCLPRDSVWGNVPGDVMARRRCRRAPRRGSAARDGRRARRRSRTRGRAPCAPPVAGWGPRAAVPRSNGRDAGVTREVFTSESELAASAAERLADAIRRRSTLVLGLPTGRTPLALYHHLRERTRADGLDWSRVRTFNLDEFVGLGRNDRGSYRRFMDERLFAHVNIAAENIGFLDGTAPDLRKECARYDRAIAAAGGIDILVLGIGANGHIGFNEPADALTAGSHRAVLDEPTRAANAMWFDGDLRQVPREALTMGMAAILSARAIVLMATGEGKAEAVRAMIEGGVTPQVPASFLQLHQQTIVLLDEPAAGDLTTKG